MRRLGGLIQLSIIIGFIFTSISGPHVVLANTITLEASSGGTITADVLASHESKTSPLGLFTETVSTSGFTPDYLLSAMASQALSFSSTTSSLLLSATGTASAQYVYLTPFDFLNNLVKPGASSSIGLTFTIDDWASFDHHSSLTSFGNAFFGQVLAGSSEIPLNSCSGCGTSGLLAPGTYHYFIFAIAPGGNPDPVGGSALYSTSFALTMVPEPSSILFLSGAFFILMVFRARRFFSCPKSR
jgi:hypothetical protein